MNMNAEKNRYLVEGEVGGEWSWMHVGDTEDACRFATRAEAEAAIEELASQLGWDRDCMRVVGGD